MTLFHQQIPKKKHNKTRIVFTFVLMDISQESTENNSFLQVIREKFRNQIGNFDENIFGIFFLDLQLCYQLIGQI